jgi:uncharacterized membrane protein YkgB
MAYNLTTNLFLVSTTQLTVVLLLTISIFFVFIAVAIIKMYKLKAQSKKMLKNSLYKVNEEKKYTDFTESHLYDNNN